MCRICVHKAVSQEQNKLTESSIPVKLSNRGQEHKNPNTEWPYPESNIYLTVDLIQEDC